jgi:hypothetical protein
MRRLPFYLVALVIVLLTAGPASSLAAEEPAAVPPEAPAPEAAPQPSTGWVPQDAAAEDAGSANAPTQRGSALGSGESSSPAPSTSEPPASTEAPAPVAAPTGAYEPSPPPVSEESTSAPQAEVAPVPVEPPVAKVEPDPGPPPAVGSADSVARSATTKEADGSEPAAAAAQVVNTVTKDSGGLPWLALILCGLVLLYAGVRVLLGPVEPEFFRSGRLRFMRRVFPGA